LQEEQEISRICILLTH